MEVTIGHLVIRDSHDGKFTLYLAIGLIPKLDRMQYSLPCRLNSVFLAIAENT